MTTRWTSNGGSTICTDESTAEPTGPSLPSGPTSPSRMAGSDRWESPPWRTRLSNRRHARYWNASTKQDFLGFSYGFRPGRSHHRALDALYVGITKRKVNWIIDADIRGFFDNISHEWLMKFLEHRIADRRMLRLLKKWLRAGVSEDGEWSPTKVGTPQGAVISPLYANVFLHYVLDLWINDWRQRHAQGEVIIVRYADDFVIGFREESDARRCLAALRERFAKFGLELHPEKTRLIEFGRYAEERRAKRGEGPPETFDFLGFTHISGKTRTRRFHDPPQNVAEEIPSQTGRTQEATLTETPRRSCNGRRVAAKCVSRLVPVLRGSRQLRTPATVPRCAPGHVAPRAASSQPTRPPPDLGEIHEALPALAPDADDPPSLSRRAVCMSTSKVRAVCGSSARTDLCGGRPAMAVPTAITFPRAVWVKRVRCL